MTTARELTTKAELRRQFWPFRSLWHILVNRIPNSNVNLCVSFHVTGLGETQQKMGSIGPTCTLLMRTRLPLEVCRTFKTIIPTQYSAWQRHWNILAPHSAGVNLCCHSVEQIKTEVSDDLLRTHRTGTLLPALPTVRL